MSQQVKGQFNQPKGTDGTEMPILWPSYTPVIDEFGNKRNIGRTYSTAELMAFAKEQGFEALPDRDDPLSFPYWESWRTTGDCPRVLTSITGIVAACFKDRPDTWKVLQQQWNHQRPSPQGQKYLQVWFADNPCYPTASAAHNLHKLVADLHCDYTTDIAYENSDGELVLRPGLHGDHLDKDKTNNSIFNLYLVTSEQNERMRYYSVEEKRMFYESRVKIDKDLIKQ
ncbi:MAG TPA: HNH endonuclease [Stenomitos sp.]